MQITQVPEKNWTWNSRKGFVPTLLKEQQLKQPLSLGDVSLPSRAEGEALGLLLDGCPVFPALFLSLAALVQPGPHNQKLTWQNSWVLVGAAHQHEVAQGKRQPGAKG